MARSSGPPDTEERHRGRSLQTVLLVPINPNELPDTLSAARWHTGKGLGAGGEGQRHQEPNTRGQGNSVGGDGLDKAKNRNEHESRRRPAVRFRRAGQA